MLGVEFNGDYVCQINGCQATIYSTIVNGITYYSMYITVIPAWSMEICTRITYEEFIRIYGFNPESFKKVC